MVSAINMVMLNRSQSIISTIDTNHTQHFSQELLFVSPNSGRYPSFAITPMLIISR